MVPKCTFQSEKSDRFTLQCECFLGRRPPGTGACRMPAPSHLPWNAVTWQRAESLRWMSDHAKGNPGEALGAAGSQGRVVTEGESGHDCHLDALLSLYGRSLLGSLLLLCGSAAGRRGNLHLWDRKLPEAYFLLFFRKITFMNSRHWRLHLERKSTSLTF